MATLTAVAARHRARWLPRVDTRLVVGLALVALSVLGGLRLSAAAEHTVAVYAVARDLPAGHVLNGGDLRRTPVHAAPDVLARLVRADAGPPRGRVLRLPLAAGALLSSGDFGTRAVPGREITIPVTPDHALGGALRTGDRVDVLGSFGKGTDAAKTLTVAEDAQVVEVVRADGLFGQREGALSALTLAVAPDDAVFLAFALRNGELDVIRAVQGHDAARARFDLAELP